MWLTDQWKWIIVTKTPMEYLGSFYYNKWTNQFFQKKNEKNNNKSMKTKATYSRNSDSDYYPSNI